MFPVPPACIAQAPMHLMCIEMHDALAVGEILSPASYNLLIYVRVPESWLDGEQINARAKEMILAQLYGPNWRSGNDDGSWYVVLDYHCRPMTPAEEAEGTWRKTDHSWYYYVNLSGALETDPPWLVRGRGVGETERAGLRRKPLPPPLVSPSHLNRG